MHENSQTSKVLRHLRNKECLSSLRAFELYKITRLSAVINVLRNLGYDIESRVVEQKDKRENYVEYVLRGEKKDGK